MRRSLPAAGAGPACRRRRGMGRAGRAGRVFVARR